MQAQRFKSAIRTQPAEQTVEIQIGRGSWRSLPRQLGISFLFAVVGSAVVAVFLNAASHAIRQVSDVALVIFVLLTFIVCLTLALNGVLRLHFRRTLIRITSERFEVEEHMPFKANRTVGWPRAGIFEVRRSGGQLHVRLRRGRPYWLLRERSKWEVDEAVAAINEALASIPQAAMAEIEGTPSNVLAYQSPGEPHEISIEQTPDGVTLIIPEAGAEFIERLIPWMMGGRSLSATIVTQWSASVLS